MFNIRIKVKSENIKVKYPLEKSLAPTRVLTSFLNWLKNKLEIIDHGLSNKLNEVLVT